MSLPLTIHPSSYDPLANLDLSPLYPAYIQAFEEKPCGYDPAYSRNGLSRSFSKPPSPGEKSDKEKTHGQETMNSPNAPFD